MPEDFMKTNFAWRRVAEALEGARLSLLAAAVPAGEGVRDIIARTVGKTDPREIAAALADDEQVQKLQKLEANSAQELFTLGAQAVIARRRAEEKQRDVDEDPGPAPIPSTLPAPPSDGFVAFAAPTLLYVFSFSLVLDLLIALAVILHSPAHVEDLVTVYAALAVPHSVAGIAACIYMFRRGR